MSESEDQLRRTSEDREPTPEDQERSQEELDRRSRATGGDAPAAGTVEQREAVAEDDDELFPGDDDRG